MQLNINDPKSFTFLNVALLLASGDGSQPTQIRVQRNGTIFLSGPPNVASVNISDIALRLETFTALGYVGSTVLSDPEWIASVYLTLKANWPVPAGASIYVDNLEPGWKLPIKESTGLEVGPLSDPPSIESMDDDEAVEAMKQWFFDNFEDPVHNMPIDGGEFQYIWGGPHDAGEQLRDAFDAGNDDLLQRAESEIEDEGVDWAPNNDRLRPEPGWQPSPYRIDTKIDQGDLRELQNLASRAQGLLNEIRTQGAGIGHNNPPEEFDDAPPLSDEEIDDLEKELMEVQGYLPTFPDLAPRIYGAIKQVGNFTAKIGAWLAKKLESFSEAAFKAAGTVVGGAVGVGLVAGNNWSTIFQVLVQLLEFGQHALGLK